MLPAGGAESDLCTSAAAAPGALRSQCMPEEVADEAADGSHLDAAIATHVSVESIILPDGTVQPMSSLGFASAPQFYTPEETPPPDAPEPPAEDLASTPAYSEPDGGGAEGDIGATSANSLPAPRLSPGWPPPYQLAVSNALWKQHWRCCFGAFRSICAGAWCVFLTIPLVFFTMVCGSHWNKDPAHVPSLPPTAEPASRFTALHGGPLLQCTSLDHHQPPATGPLAGSTRPASSRQPRHHHIWAGPVWTDGHLLPGHHLP